MAEVLPRHYVFGMIAFAFLIMAGATLIAEFNQGEQMASSEDIQRFNNSFNKIEEVQDLTGGLQQSIENADTEGNWGIFGVLNSLIASAWQTLKTFFASIGFMNAVFTALPAYFPGFPSWIPALVISIIASMIVFAIFSLIFQRDA